MAEVTALRNNVLSYPCYGLPWGLVFPIFDNTGALVSGAAGLDSERSLNGDTFADCTNEATEIATSSGMYYLLLTPSELSANVLTVIVKTSTTDAKTTPMTLYPRQLVRLRASTCQSGSTNIVRLDAGASALDGAYTGCLVVVTIDGVVNVRLIDDYNGATKDCDIDVDFTASPDSDDPFVIYRPDGVLIQTANVTAWNDAQVATPSVAGVPEVDLTHVAGATTNVAALATNVDAILTDTGTTLQGELDGIETDVDTLLTRIGTPSNLGGGATVAANLSDIEGQTDDIGAAGAGLTALATAAELAKVPKSDSTVTWNATALASIQTEANDALVANHLDHLLAVTYDPASKPGAADALLNELVESDGGVARYTANALELAPTGGSAPTAADIADAVWDEATSGHTTSGTFGEQAKTDIDTIVTATAAGAIRTAVGLASANLDTQLGDLPTNAELTSALGTADDATLAAIAALNNVSTAQVQTSAAAALTAYDPPTRAEATSDKAEILTAVDAVPTNAELTAALAAADDAVLAAIAALNNLSAAQVNAQVLDVLNVDTFAEPAAVPAATATLAAKLGWLMVLARNTVQQTATTQTLKADNGSTTIATAAVSDDGSEFVRNKWS